MIPLIISLISFSSSQDVSIDVYLPGSPNTDTEVYISTSDEEVRISYEDTSLPEYGYYAGTARVNSDEGSSKNDELTVSVSNSWDEGYTSNTLTVSTPNGASVTFGAGASAQADNTTVNITEEVYVTSYHPDTGSKTDKVQVNTTVVSNGTDTAYVTTVEANVGNATYQEVEIGYVDQNGNGASVSVFEFSEAGQVESSSGNWMTLAGLALLAGILVLAYKRWAGESVKTYQMVTRPVEADYIRI